PRDAVVVLMLITAPIQIWIVLEKFGGKIKLMRPWIGFGALLGVPIGTYVLSALESRELLLTIGVVLLVATAVLTFSKPSNEERSNRAIEPAVGLVSGTLSGAFGTGAAPLILYLQWMGLSRSDFRATTMSVFLVASVARVPTYAVAGLFTVERLWSAVLLAPAVGAGLWAGQRIHLKMNEKLFRRAVLVGLLLLGAALVIKNV
ncbi:MAG: sulfite exporter TauE/SafE family protein, partial [Myxococcota bacterium]